MLLGKNPHVATSERKGRRRPGRPKRRPRMVVWAIALIAASLISGSGSQRHSYADYGIKSKAVRLVEDGGADIDGKISKQLTGARLRPLKADDLKSKSVHVQRKISKPLTGARLLPLKADDLGLKAVRLVEDGGADVHGKIFKPLRGGQEDDLEEMEDIRADRVHLSVGEDVEGPRSEMDGEYLTDSVPLVNDLVEKGRSNIKEGIVPDFNFAHSDEAEDEIAKITSGTCNTGGNPHWIGNGHCDSSLNNAECGWDGGDCCEETCIPTCKYECPSFQCKGLDASMEGGRRKATDTIVYALSEEQKDSAWLIYFFTKWGYFPMDPYNEGMKDLEEELEDSGEWEQIEAKALEAINEKLLAKGEKALNIAANRVVSRSLNMLVAQEVVKASVKGGKTAAGRRLAIAVVARPTTLLVAQSSAVAFRAVASASVGIAPVIAEYATTQVLRAFGVTDATAIVVGGAVSSILAGAIAGSLTGAAGGPIGAAAGAVAGAGSWLIGEGISGLFNTPQGPNNNWCYIIKGSNWESSDRVSLYTYKGDDGWRLISYWRSNTDEFSEEKVMSAGQQHDEFFQLQVGSKLLPRVYYQDTIFIGKDTCGNRMACHCGGSFNQEMPGMCKCLDL